MGSELVPRGRPVSKAPSIWQIRQVQKSLIKVQAQELLDTAEDDAAARRVKAAVCRRTDLAVTAVAELATLDGHVTQLSAGAPGLEMNLRVIEQDTFDDVRYMLRKSVT